MRYLKEGENNIRLGFVIVDPSIRGKGYGKQMLKLAVDHARKDLNASSANVDVFHSDAVVFIEKQLADEIGYKG